MYVYAKKINAQLNTVTYHFFVEAEKDYGVFEINLEKEISMQNSFNLIKSLEHEKGDSLYLRAKGTVFKSYKANGTFPNAINFMGG